MIIFPATYGEERYPYFLKPQLSYLDDHVNYGMPIVKVLLLQPIVVGFILGIFQSMTNDKAIKWYGHIVGICSIGLLYVYYQYVS